MSTEVICSPINTSYNTHESSSLLGLLSLSEGGGQTQDGLSVLGSCGDRLWDHVQRLCVQLHAGLRGHTHDEVRVCVYRPPILFYDFFIHDNFFLQSTQALGGRRPRGGQSEEPDVSAADS